MITARYHREIPRRYRLEASLCENCKRAYMPARKVCPVCKGQDLVPSALASEGTLCTYTIIHVGAENFSQETPYAVGIVELDKGVKLTMQVDRPPNGELSIGQKVQIVFRRIRTEGRSGIICYGYKAVVDGSKRAKG
jgi:uncharacterized OB-fold protein